MALGAALARGSELEEAGKLLDRGVANLRARGEPLDIADALLVSAPVRRALEGPAPARAMLEEAGSLLASCPNPGVLSSRLLEVARTLTPAHRRIEGDSDLTQRELEVLRYLAEGLTKREIGKELFLSFNTIHSHTKSILPEASGLVAGGCDRSCARCSEPFRPRRSSAKSTPRGSLRASRAAEGVRVCVTRSHG